MATTPGGVCVLGSAVVDLVLSPQGGLPRPGRTVLAPSYSLLPGGKGANQAFAAAKVGCPRVEFVGATGDDGFAKVVLDSLKSVGVGVSGARTTLSLSGFGGRVYRCTQGEGCQVTAKKEKNANKSFASTRGRVGRPVTSFLCI